MSKDEIGSIKANNNENTLMRIGDEAIESIEQENIDKINKENEIILMEAFQYYDKDGSGYLERDEIKEMVIHSAKM